MKFCGVCIETDNAPRLAGFYKIVLKEEPFVEGSHYGFGKIAVYNPGGVTVAKDKNIWLTYCVADLDEEYEQPNRQKKKRSYKKPFMKNSHYCTSNELVFYVYNAI